MQSPRRPAPSSSSSGRPGTRGALRHAASARRSQPSEAADPPGIAPATVEGGDGGRDRSAGWRTGLALGLLVSVVLVVLVLHAGSAQNDFVSAFRHVRASSIPWLLVAVAAEGLSLFFYACLHRRLLVAGGARLGIGTMVALTVSSTGIASLMPGGSVPSSGWLIDQYRRRSVPVSLGLWAVLAGGFTATVSVLAMLLIGAAVAGISRAAVLAAAGVALVGGSAALVLAFQRLLPSERGLGGRDGRLGRLVDRLHNLAVEVAQYRAGYRGGAAVFTYSTLNWLLDAAVLVAAFEFVGLPVPWGALLFAYAASQTVAGLIPLPAGVGVVAGGLLGGFALGGVAAGGALAAVLVYRIVSYWAVAAVGSTALVAMSHHRRPAPASPCQCGVPGRGSEIPLMADPVAANCS